MSHFKNPATSQQLAQQLEPDDVCAQIQEMRALEPVEKHIRRLRYHGYLQFSWGQFSRRERVWGFLTVFKGKEQFFTSLESFEAFCFTNEIPLLPPGTSKSVRLKNE